MCECHQSWPPLTLQDAVLEGLQVHITVCGLRDDLNPCASPFGHLDDAKNLLALCVESSSRPPKVILQSMLCRYAETSELVSTSPLLHAQQPLLGMTLMLDSSM